MVKTKAVKVEGEVISVPDDKLKLEEKPIQVSYTQAKKLVKKEMTDKQKANIEKLVEMNRIKWEERKKQKEEEQKKQQAQKEEQELETHTKVIVKPKRIYPKREKKPKKEIMEESESEVDASESDEEYQLRKTKKKVETKKQLISEIDNFIKQVKKPNNYMDALNSVWK